MPITINTNGVLHELTGITVNMGGTLHEFDTVHANESGVLYEIFSGDIFVWNASSNTAIVSVENKGRTLVFKPLSYNSSNSTRRIYSNKFSMKAGQKVTFDYKKESRAATLNAVLYKSNGTKVGAIYSISLTKVEADMDGEYYIEISGNTWNTSSPSGSSSFVSANITAEFEII